MILVLATLAVSSLALAVDPHANDGVPGGDAAAREEAARAEGAQQKADAQQDTKDAKGRKGVLDGLTLRPVGLLQLWGTVYDFDENAQADATGYGDPEDDPGVKVKRARLGVRADWGELRLGLVGGAGARYDAFSEDERDFSLYEASLGWEHVAGGCRLGVDAGVIELPFSADAMIGSGELTFEERGLAAEHIADDRGTGIVGRAGSKGGGITGTLGVFNSGFDPFGDDNLGKTLVFRVDGKLGKRNTNVLWDVKKDRDGVGVGLGAAGLYTADVATTTMGATGDVVLRAGPVTAFGEGTFANIKPGATDVASPEVTDPTTQVGVTGELNVALGRFQPAARVSWLSDSALGSWTDVLGGVIVHVGTPDMADVVRIGAGYVLRLESDPVQNDTVRLWVQAKI